jgi:hypothetical protein
MKMKKIFNYLIAGAAVLTLATACSEDQLETSPTTAVSGTTMTQSSDAAMIALNGIYRSMYTSGWSTTGNTHQCFGISAYNLCADVMGDDHIMAAQGNGWFWFDARYNVKARFTSGAWRSYDLWFAFYQWISNANYLIAMDEEGLTDIDKMYVLGQAYAVRGYSYWMLSQYFARTYKGHESEPCVPIYTEPSVAGTQGHPRASVAEVYEQAKNDLAKSVDYLSRSLKTSLDEDKSYITYPVALGIQARIALTMEDWNTAKTAAETVISLGQYSIQAVSPAAFKKNTSNFINNAGAGNVMWGAGIIADQSGIYASLYSHMDHYAEMYGGYDAAPKCMNIDTYNLMGAADTRRCWWNPNDETVPYIQEKMVFSDINTYLGDYVYMRIEEMYLTAAEAECMLGNEDAARNYLNTLVKTRDANYNCTATGTAMGKLTSDRTGSLREAIIDQRRIELWGEFGRLYDIKRLKQGFIRTTAQGWPNDPNILLTNRPSDDPENYMWVLTIPQAEFDGNSSLDPEKDQNPTGDK